MHERTPEDAAALLAIQRLQAAYGDAVTRRAWDEVRALFEPDAVVEIDTRDPARGAIRLEGPDAIAGFVERALENFAFFEFAILNAVADLDGDRAWGRVYICELRHDHEGGWSEAYGLYQDLYRRRDGRWSIAGRRYASLARRGERTVSFGVPPTEPATG